jgi:molecular chaperone GrpE
MQHSTEELPTVPEGGDENGAPLEEASVPVQPDCAAQLEETKDQLLRLAAEFENFRKRARREQEETRQYGTERVVRDFLEVLDNLERAVGHAAQNDDPMIQGIRMVVKQFRDVLGHYGVTPFDSVGAAFDPSVHEAISQVPSAEVAAGTVIQEALRGYKMHDRLLRPARVVIAMAPEVMTH